MPFALEAGIPFGALACRKPSYAIMTVAASGGEPRPFGLGPMHDIKSPAVHPDGKQMAFVDEAVNQQLWVLKNLFGEKKAAR